MPAWGVFSFSDRWVLMPMDIDLDVHDGMFVVS
jgi:hypothetical protein